MSYVSSCVYFAAFQGFLAEMTPGFGIKVSSSDQLQQTNLDFGTVWGKTTPSGQILIKLIKCSYVI